MKVGDSVICVVDYDDFLIKGKTYRITKIKQGFAYLRYATGKLYCRIEHVISCCEKVPTPSKCKFKKDDIIINEVNDMFIIRGDDKLDGEDVYNVLKIDITSSWSDQFLKKSIDKNYKKMTLFKLIQRGYL
jgi:hypothetical protein